MFNIGREGTAPSGPAGLAFGASPYGICHGIEVRVGVVGLQERVWVPLSVEGVFGVVGWWAGFGGVVGCWR